MGMKMEQEPSKPRFTPGPLTANGNGVHKGIRCVAITFDPENGRRDTDVAQANARLFAAAPVLYEAAKKTAHELSVMLALNPARDGGLYREALDKLIAALALVDGSQAKETKQMDNEQNIDELDAEQIERIEIEDGRRCGECGSTEMGHCVYCKMD